MEKKSVQSDFQVDPKLQESNYDAEAGRPRIKKYANSEDSKFCVGDKVWLSQGRGLKGPYLVSSVPASKKYKLCDEAGNSVENGSIFDEDKLSFA